MTLKSIALLNLLLPLAASAASTTPAVAPAGPVISKDWRLDDCVASTTATLKGASYRLEVALDPSQLRPLELRIVPSAEMSPVVQAINFALDRKTIYAFAALNETGAKEFWSLPRGTRALLSYLKRESKFQVDLLDGAKGAKIAFSLKGSTTALNTLQKQCNGGQDLGADGFERAFLPAAVANVDATQIQAADTEKLRDLVKTAFAAFRSSNDTQAQLNTLSNQYFAQLTEFEQLTKNLDKLTHDTVVKLKQRQTDAQSNIDRANVEIPQLKAQVTSQEAALDPANQALDQAKAVLAPLSVQLQRYQDDVEDKKNEVSAAESDVSRAQTYESQTQSHLQDVISGAEKAANDITAIQNEINSLRTDVQNANCDVDQMRRAFNEAQSRRQNFNRSAEIQRRLCSDSRLSSIEASIRDAQTRMMAGRQHIADAEADRARFNGDLHNCQATAGKDCTRELDLANRAEQRMQQAQNEFNGLQNTLRDLQSQRDNFQSTITREVDRDYNELLRCENNAMAKVNDALSRANQIVSQLNQAQNADLPQAQRNLNSWQNARGQAESDVRAAQAGTATANRNLVNAQSDLAASRSRRDRWKQTSGYNQMASDLSNAQKAVNTIKATLKSLDNGIASREKLIRDETQSLADTATQMQNAIALIQQKESRSADVQKLLAPYFQQRDLLAAQKATSDQAFKDAQVAFAAALPPAVTPVAAK